MKLTAFSILQFKLHILFLRQKAFDVIYFEHIGVVLRWFSCYLCVPTRNKILESHILMGFGEKVLFLVPRIFLAVGMHEVRNLLYRERLKQIDYKKVFLYFRSQTKATLNPAVVAWCAYSSASHSAEGMLSTRWIESPSHMVY